MVDCCLDLAANRQGSGPEGNNSQQQHRQRQRQHTILTNHVGGMMVYWANKATSILFNQAEMCTKLRLNCATTTTKGTRNANHFCKPTKRAQNFDNEIGENEKLSV